MNNLKKENTVIGCILLALSVYYWHLTANLQFRQAAHRFGPDTLPYVFAGAMFVLSVLLIIEGYVKNTGPANAHPLGRQKFLRVALLFAVLIGYVLSVMYISYLIATPVVLAVLLYMGGSRKPLEIILTSGLVTAGVYILFTVVFRVRI